MNSKKLKFIGIFLLIDLLIIVAVFSYKYSARSSKLTPWEKKASVESAASMEEIASLPNKTEGWPPRLQATFPSVALTDHTGASFSMSSLIGKPVLVEFVAMTCAGCQAWSGGHSYGGFEGFAVQGGLESIEKYFTQYTGLKLLGGPVQFVQIVFYNTTLTSPTPQQLSSWRTHFHFDGYSNVHVVTGGEALRNKESFSRVPGFLLLDKEGIVQFEALGHSPRHNLYRELLPAVKRYL
jgi:hypothetical protein